MAIKKLTGIKIPGSTDTYQFTAITDKNLTQSDVPADAQIVGNKIKSLVKTFSQITGTPQSDSSVSGYNYKIIFSTPGVTSNSYPIVTFSNEDAASGNFSPTAESGNGQIIVYASTSASPTVDILVVTPSI